jgi:hypothetical protein
VQVEVACALLGPLDQAVVGARAEEREVGAEREAAALEQVEVGVVLA